MRRLTPRHGRKMGVTLRLFSRETGPGMERSPGAEWPWADAGR